MSLFPQSGPGYYNEKDKGILDKMSDFYSSSITINQSFWSEADTDARFEAGDQTLWDEIYRSQNKGRHNNFNFNRIRRITNMISGHQRRNRKSTIVVPVENGDSKTADQFSKIMFWINQQESVLETISDAFHGSLITGMNMLHVWSDFRSDPVSGDIKVDNCSYNSFLIDPFFRKADLSDCNALWKRTYLTKRECISLLPSMKEAISELSESNVEDGKFEFMPESGHHNKSKLMTYDEFYYRDYRSQKMLIDSQTGESIEWTGDKVSLEEYLRLYPQVTVTNQDIPTVRLAVVVQGNVMYDGPTPLGIDSYPFVPVFSYYKPQLSDFTIRIQGVVRGLRDAQYLYNRRKIIELDILESQISSGWKYKENALVDPKDVFLSGQGRGLALKSDAQMSDVERIQPAQVPSSMIHLSESLAREIQEISGVNEELLGSAVDDKAGILSMLRQGAGLTTLQGLFDQLDRSQKLLGKLILKSVQANFTPGKVKRIVEEEPMPQFYNKSFGKYDSAVEEGSNTTTQRQMQFAQLLHLREIGIAIPDSVIIEASTVQNKSKLIEATEEANKSRQEIEMLNLRGTVEQQKAQTKLTNARALADKGLGIERLSRVGENQALATERRAEASKDRDQGLLNMVKALKEIDDIDLRQVEKMVALSKMIRVRDEKYEDEDSIKKQVNVNMENS